MSDSRTVNTRRNLVSGMLKQLQAIVLPFVVRTIVLYTLGAEYQGLSSLFNSILHMLNLADLGFSTAVVYILYKPIADNDYRSVCAIIAYLRRVYYIVGGVILAAGLAIMPLLPTLISGTFPQTINIYILYLFYLLNTVISYWLFAYKSALLTAMQREDLVSNIYTVTSFLLKLVQIATLLLFANYYLYIAVMPVFTIANNVLLQVVSRKYFPHIIPEGRVSEDTRNNLSKQLKGLMINKIGDVARNGCDSIFLSVFLGLTALAIYDNYYYIYSALYGVTLVVTHAMQASVGNSVAKESVKKNYQDLKRFNFLFSWFTGWCTVCLCCLYQPFMLIWMKGDTSMLFSTGNMLLFCLYFYAINMNNMRNMYVNAVGLYWELRIWYIVEAVGNIVLNGLLGYFWGITGIILATIITVFICNFITRTNVLFKSYFKIRPTEFYKQHFWCFFVMVINCMITSLGCSFITQTGIFGLVLKALVCIILPNVFFLLVYFKTLQFKHGVSLLKTVLKRR